MKRILLPRGLLSLLLFVGLVFVTDSQNRASSNPDTTKESSDTHGSAPAEKAKTATEANHGKLEMEAAGEPDLPAALGRHIEKLMRTIPGNNGEGPAASAAEWKFRAQAYPDKDISLDKIEGARTAHAAHLAKGFASADATSTVSTWVSLGPT